MVTNKNGISIDDGTFRKIKSRRANIQEKRISKRYDRYIEMRHKSDRHKSVVTPFDKAYIKQLKNEGYKLVDDFKIRLGG